MSNVNNVDNNLEEIKGGKTMIQETITEEDMLGYFAYTDTNSWYDLDDFIIQNLDFEYDEDATVNDLYFHMKFYGLNTLEEARIVYRKQLSDRTQLMNICYIIINMIEIEYNRNNRY